MHTTRCGGGELTGPRARVGRPRALSRAHAKHAGSDPWVAEEGHVKENCPMMDEKVSKQLEEEKAHKRQKASGAAN